MLTSLRYMEYISMWNRTFLVGRKRKTDAWYLEAMECDAMLQRCGKPFAITNQRNRIHVSVAHNAAFWKEGGTLYVMGGIRNPQRVARGTDHSEDHVYYSEVASLDSLRAKDYRFRFLWARIGTCTERIPHLNRICPFDGKFSSVFLNGALIVHARANMCSKPMTAVEKRRVLFGGRHLQVTYIQQRNNSTASFQAVTLQNYTLEASNNIYYACVHENPMKPHTMIGVFAASHANGSALSIAFTNDGLHFSRMTDLATSNAQREFRGDLYPICGLHTTRTHVHFFYQQNLPDFHTEASYVHTVSLDHHEMRYLTRNAWSKMSTVQKNSLRHINPV